MDVICANNSVKPTMESEFGETPLKVKTGAKYDMGGSNGKVLINAAGSGTISFHNITYTVEQRTCCKKRPPKVILDDVRYVD